MFFYALFTQAKEKEVMINSQRPYFYYYDFFNFSISIPNSE